MDKYASFVPKPFGCRTPACYSYLPKRGIYLSECVYWCNRLLPMEKVPPCFRKEPSFRPAHIWVIKPRVHRPAKNALFR